MRDDHFDALFNTPVNQYGYGWISKTAKQFGMTEPVPLDMNNVMFPFTYLGASVLFSFAIVTLEKLVKKLNDINAMKSVVRIHPVLKLK